LPEGISETVSWRLDVTELSLIFALSWSAYVRLLSVKDGHASVGSASLGSEQFISSNRSTIMVQNSLRTLLIVFNVVYVCV